MAPAPRKSGSSTTTRRSTASPAPTTRGTISTPTGMWIDTPSSERGGLWDCARLCQPGRIVPRVRVPGCVSRAHEREVICEFVHCFLCKEFPMNTFPNRRRLKVVTTLLALILVLLLSSTSSAPIRSWRRRWSCGNSSAAKITASCPDKRRELFQKFNQHVRQLKPEQRRACFRASPIRCASASTVTSPFPRKSEPRSSIRRSSAWNRCAANEAPAVRMRASARSQRRQSTAEQRRRPRPPPPRTPRSNHGRRARPLCRVFSRPQTTPPATWFAADGRAREVEDKELRKARATPRCCGGLRRRS